MEKVYTSCIKINGVPVLPPLMTQDLREEMKFYKQLATEVEKRLKAFNLTKETKEKNDESFISNVDDSFNSEIECDPLDLTSNGIISTDHPMEVENLETVGTKDPNDSCNITSDRTWKSISDEENAHHNEAEAENNTSSDTTSLSTDLNQYLNESTETSTYQEQLKKLQVPKTLDIITVFEKDLNPSTDSNQVSKVSEISENTPKLIRRGSYILDSPSPLLMAQIQMGKTKSDYVPTPTNNIVKRKEWNISQAKAEWENQLKNNELVIMNSSSTTFGFRLRRNTLPSVYNQRIYSTIYHSRSVHSYDLPQQTRSADCIQAMIANETVFDDKRYDITSSLTKYDASYKETSNISMKSCHKKLGGSLSIFNDDSNFQERNESFQGNESSGSESYDYRVPKSNGMQSRNKLSPKVTFEKIVCIFKQVQEQHKKRMSDLIALQYREQLNLEEDFKHQEKQLIAEIKKAFPEFSISALMDDYTNTEKEAPQASRTVKSNSTNSKLLNSSNTKVSKSPYSNKALSTYSKSKINSSRSSKIATKRYTHSASETCPLERISSNKFVHSVSCHQISNQGTQTADSESLSSGSCFISRKQLNEKLDNSFSQEQIVKCREHSTVSRTLLPLESKSTLVPVVDNTLYTDKHIKAATTINKYIRGYLVRRMMNTEHVNTLRNTYKEAIKCMLKLHVDAPLSLSELKLHQRLQLQCDAASMNIVEIFSRSSAQRMEIIAHDRELKKLRTNKPYSSRSYSFATQRTLARKKMKEMGAFQKVWDPKISSARSRCQTWTANSKEKRSPNTISLGIKRSTSAGAVRKPWR